MKKQEREFLVKDRNEMYEDYGIRAIIFPILWIIILVGIISLIILNAIIPSEIVSLLLIAMNVILFLLVIFNIFEILDLFKLDAKRSN